MVRNSITSCCLLIALIGTNALAQSSKSRLIVMADMGNEPDEEQQMTHLLMYANMVELEGLIACSGKYLHADRRDGRTKVHPELFHKLVDGYAAVLGNLKQHASGWPEAIICAASSRPGQPSMESRRSSQGSPMRHPTDRSRHPEEGSAETLHRGQRRHQHAGTGSRRSGANRSQEEMDRLCSRIIVFENGAQDNSGAWIAGHYPKIAWHRSNHQTYAYGGPGGKDSIQGPYTWEPYERTADGQNEWAKQHIMTNHGALGMCFPPRLMGRLHFLEGGGTIPWMGLVNRGLTDPERLYWGGWSGRFSRTRHPEYLLPPPGCPS